MQKENKLILSERLLIYILAFTQFIPQFSFVFYVYIFIALITDFKKHKDKEIKDPELRFSYSFIVFAGFVLLSLVSFAYSSNVAQILRHFEKLIPFICVILYFVFTRKERKYDFEKVLSYYSLGALFTLILILILSFYHLFWGNLKAQIIYSGITNIDYFNFLNHRTYLSFSLIMAIPIWFYDLKHKDRFNKIPYVFAILFLLVLIIVSGSRAAIISAIFVIFNGLYFIYLKNLSFTAKASLAGAAIIFITLIFLFHPRFEQIRDFIKKDEDIARVEPRIKIWEAGFNTWKKSPVWGVGIGDMRDALDQTFIEKDYIYELNNEFNSHNQFLQTAIGVGIVGLILLILVFVFLYYEVGNKFFISSFIIVVAVNFMFESMLERNICAFPMAFWIIIFIDSIKTGKADFYDRLNSKSYHKFQIWASIFLFSFTSIFYIFAGSQKFNSLDPKTYVPVKFNTHVVNKKSEDNLPFTDYVSLENSDIKLRSFAKGSFFILSIKDTILSENRKVDFSIWCNISQNSNIDSLYIYLWDKNRQSYLRRYNFDKKSDWQHLVLCGIEISGNIEFGLRFDLIHKIKESKQLNGEIMISKPEYKFY